MRYLGQNSEEHPAAPPRRHELVIEILKFLTPALGLVLFLLGLNSKYPWLSKPWVVDTAVILGIFILIWFAKPRWAVWFQRIRDDRRDRQFVRANDVGLRELLGQFAVFISSSDTRSLSSILRSVHSQNMQAVEQIIAADYVGSWLHCFQEQLTFPAKSFHQFLGQCREFSYIVQSFNTNYVLRAQRQLATGTPLAENSIAQLEGFREEYNAFLRDVEPWAKGISDYLQSGGVTDHPSLWRIAPVTYFERPRSFARTKLAGA